MYFLILQLMKQMLSLSFNMRVFYLLVLLIVKPVFGLDINKSIKSTIEKNKKVTIAFEKLTESKELIENAYGQKLPSITTAISGTYSNSEKDSATTITTPETFTDKYKLTYTQNIFDAGVNNLEIDRSKILYENEVINFKKSIQNLILDAINGYLTVINNQKLYELNKKNYDSVSRVLEETVTRYDLGSATLYDLQNAESAFATSETDLFISSQNYEVSKKAFARIVGLNPIELDEFIEFDDDLNIVNILDNVESNNYDLLVLQNDMINKKILIEKQKKSNAPSLDLSASAEYSDTCRIDSGTETTDGTIALTLTIPIFQQNIDKSEIRKYQSQLLQTELNYEDLKADLEIQAMDLYKNYQISKSEIDTNLKRIKSKETSLESIIEEYKIGTKTITDLIDTESELLSIYVSYFDSKKDFIQNYFKIKALEGNLVNTFQNYLPKFE